MKRILTVIVLISLLPMMVYGQEPPKRILFFGDSITAGYGIGEENAFPAFIQQKIDSLDWNFKAVNGGSSGETSAGGLSRIDWMLRQPVSVFVLELGGNDGLRGIDLDATKQNLQKIIDKVEAKYPDASIVITGMQVPPNLGPDYTREFKEIYPELAEENNAELIPYFLDELGGDSELMQSDGIHPTEAGHRLLADKTWNVLKPILESKRADNHAN
ncbi:arylesterase [Aliifodinibius salipaludis]|uniref:Arylesterase n=1 Tax=Fodinibius salipaludis TaxID=2032627 RepID=A0A2A2G636_9BACT|nr:arylesterase [Aliifodinibius salipaludis]PAU93091.1 arylesterase [Aliifodinibius salipaludis]